MKNRGEVINEYAKAFAEGTEGERLLETMKVLSSLQCSDQEKAACLKQEIDHIVCGYLRM